MTQDYPIGALPHNTSIELLSSGDTKALTDGTHFKSGPTPLLSAPILSLCPVTMVTRRTPKTREIEFVIAAYLTYRQILSQTRCRVDDSMTRGFTQWFKTWPYVHFVFLKEKSFQKKKKQKKHSYPFFHFSPISISVP